jgi:peroxiredoxin
VGLNSGDLIPEIIGNDIEGTEFRLSDYKGKVIMLDFWGNW